MLSLQKRKTRKAVLRHRKQSRGARSSLAVEGEPIMISKIQNQKEPPAPEQALQDRKVKTFLTFNELEDILVMQFRI